MKRHDFVNIWSDDAELPERKLIYVGNPSDEIWTTKAGNKLTVYIVPRFVCVAAGIFVYFAIVDPYADNGVLNNGYIEGIGYTHKASAYLVCVAYRPIVS